MFVVGLLPYIYLPLRARTNSPMNWGNPSSLQRFWDHVVRHQYGAVGPTKTTEPLSMARLGPQFWYLGNSLADDLTPCLTVIGVLGLGLLAWRNRPLMSLCILWILCTGGLFVLLANFDLDRTSRWAMRVFFIPVSLGFIIPLAFLLDRGVDLARGRLSARPWLLGGLYAALVAAGPFIQVVSHWRQCNYSNYWYAYDHARNLLSCMLPKAMIFPSGDQSTIPLVYLTMVENQRPDVLIADIYGYTTPDLYRDRPADTADDPETWLIKHAYRPVYYTTKRPSPVENATVVQAGLLYHLLPRNMTFGGDTLLHTCHYRNLASPTIVDLGASHIMADFEFFRGLDRLAKNDAKAALGYFATSAKYGHDIKEVYNNIGSALAEHRIPKEAIPYFHMAACLDPGYATPRWNLFRLYQDHGDYEEARVTLEELITGNPRAPQPYSEMGFLLDRHCDDQQEAARYWREALRLNPDQPAVIRELNRLTTSNSTAADGANAKTKP